MSAAPRPTSRAPPGTAFCPPFSAGCPSCRRLLARPGRSSSPLRGCGRSTWTHSSAAGLTSPRPEGRRTSSQSPCPGPRLHREAAQHDQHAGYERLPQPLGQRTGGEHPPDKHEVDQVADHKGRRDGDRELLEAARLAPLPDRLVARWQPDRQHVAHPEPEQDEADHQCAGLEKRAEITRPPGQQGAEQETEGRDDAQQRGF